MCGKKTNQKSHKNVLALIAVSDMLVVEMIKKFGITNGGCVIGACMLLLCLSCI